MMGSFSSGRNSPDWRVKKAQAVRAEFLRGSLDESTQDSLVLRLLRYWKNGPSSDEELHAAVTLNLEYAHIAKAILDEINCGDSCYQVAIKHSIGEDIITLLQELYDDREKVGSNLDCAVTRAREMSPGDRKRYLLRRKYGKYYDICMDGVKALGSSLSPKEIKQMVQHALVQSYMIATSADQVELDSGEQKTVLAYNQLMIGLIRLNSELEASSTDTSAILERMASYTSRIPKDVPRIPSLDQLSEISSPAPKSKFKLAPIEEVRNTNE